MCVEEDGRASGIFLRNSNAMEVILQPEPAVVFRTTGGVLDFFVFLGPTPEAVIQQYMRIVGRPTLPPIWSLGFHIGRQNMGNVSNLEEILRKMDISLIPFDSVHLGDNILRESIISFTMNDIEYNTIEYALLETVRREGRRVTVPTWAGVADRSDFSYPAREEAQAQRMFVHQSEQQDCKGQLFRQTVLYPDYSHANAEEYWASIVKQYRNRLKFDTLYLDKNTPTNERDGCDGFCVRNKWNTPPYVPAALRPALSKQTLCPDSLQVAGRHYNVHNHYGLHQARAAFKGSIKAFPRERPLIMTRSHAPGIGRYAGHFISDTNSDWTDFRRSLVDIMQLNLVGIPLVGNDICGFYGNTTETLCARWIQAGAFYPFSRSYNHGNSRDQFPAAWGDTTQRMSAEALRLRYTLLPYLYTLFYLVSAEGGTVVRPLFHEFPTDSQTLTINDQFLWGPGLLICPLVKPPENREAIYLPRARWFDIRTGSEKHALYGQTTIPREDLTVLVRGGHVIPMHNESNITTYNSRPYRLVVALDDEENAEGKLFVDDGDKPFKQAQDGSGVLLDFQMTKDSFVVKPIVALTELNSVRERYIQSVEFWGLKRRPEKIEINQVVCPLKIQCDYDSLKKILTVNRLKFKMSDKRDNIIRITYRDDAPYNWEKDFTLDDTY